MIILSYLHQSIFQIGDFFAVLQNSLASSVIQIWDIVNFHLALTTILIVAKEHKINGAFAYDIKAL